MLVAEAASTVADAVETLGAVGVERALSAAPAADPLDARSPRARIPELLRLHGIAAARAADRVARAVAADRRDDAVTAALVHDVGKLALAPDLEWLDGRAGPLATPEARLGAERAAFGTDHAELGGRLARHWGLHARLVWTIEHHHDEDADDEVTAIVRLADMLAHYEREAAIDLDRMLALADRLGLGRDAVSSLLYDIPFPLPPPARSVDPCPLSARELDVVRQLSEGMLYKQIAAAEGLSPSTVRNHLHRAYTKLDVADRAQAVLVSKQRGWI